MIVCSIKKARIAYAGPALTDGEMDVRELAPALIAFAEFISNAGKAIGCEQNIKVMLNQYHPRNVYPAGQQV